MFIYVILEALAAIAIGILLAVRTKRSENVIYSRLDKVGVITNVILTALYTVAAPFYLFLGMISEPSGEGALWILGLIVSVAVASVALYCGLGLGFSVALRRKGRGRLSFIVQFAGVVGIGLMVLLYGLFVGTLIAPLN